jgi:WD40 repeat protein
LDNGHLLLIKASDGTLIREGSPHSGQVTGVAWSPDGKRIATSSTDSTLSLIDPATGDTLASLVSTESDTALALAVSTAELNLLQAQKNLDEIGTPEDITLSLAELEAELAQARVDELTAQDAE